MRVLLLTLVLVMASLAGCITRAVDDESPLSEARDGDNESLVPTAAGGLGAKETDATEEGVDGQPHIHDYWQGRQKVDVFQGRVSNNFYPIIPEQDLSKGVFMGVVRLPDGELVFEGAGKLEIVASAPSELLTGLRMAYRAPNMDEMSEMLNLPFDEPLEIQLTPQMADMPHATKSLWRWFFYADGTGKPFYGSFDLTITVYRDRNVEMWPGHPDFYKDRTHRVILDDKEWTSRYFGFEELFFSTQRMGGMLRPDYLISMGTDRLDVFVNVTRTDAPLEPTNFLLEYVNATRDEVRRVQRQEGTELPFVHFKINVDETSHDSPYAENSRWGFRLLATFANAGLCPGCFPYEITYRVTIIAYPPDPEAEEREKAE